ncbi:Protein translocase subunit SecE [uncultured archaeon]|nr:Protein translocase subunit SecE [uncultured archaeon]
MSEEEKPGFAGSSKSFFIKCKRVWTTLKKPSRKEFETIAKVSAIGIVLLGAVGFLISIIIKLIFP